MDIGHLDEPELQFADGVHIDIRAGITHFGTLDREEGFVPRPIRIGVVGSAGSVDGVCDWLKSSADGVVSTEERLRDLRPDFPGIRTTTFGTTLELNPSTARTVSARDLEKALQGADVRPVVDLFFEHARDVTEGGRVDVVVIAPPADVFAHSDPKPSGEGPLDEGSEENPAPYVASFHDVFKARALELSSPCQLVRPDTYGGGSTRKTRRRPSLQDDSTRAWNFHTALYYKAGGVPWRLVRDSTALTALFVGISFFRSHDGERILTSVAQVFDERGEGVVVQGAHPQINKDDRSPHLSATDSNALLLDALACYRREHRTSPARLVVHKTSYFDDDEIAGFNGAAESSQVEVLDLVSVRRSDLRLFRTGTFPVLRGTTIAIEDGRGIVYLRGSVPQFRTYPGMYVPSALEFNRSAGESSTSTIALEMLQLSKLNFNNTQFDGGEPITVRAARRVGDILKHVTPARVHHTRFRYFT